MPRFDFPAAEIVAEHRRRDVQNVLLQVEMVADAGLESANFTGAAEIEGEFGMECRPGENPLRPGMMPLLKLTTPDGRFTRVAVLLTELKTIEPLPKQQRLYRWRFLVPRRPVNDPARLFRRPGEVEPPPPTESIWPSHRVPRSTIQSDPEAFEISLEVLLASLGPTTAVPPPKFTTEGGLKT